jgi:hypothetical protein
MLPSAAPDELGRSGTLCPDSVSVAPLCNAFVVTCIFSPALIEKSLVGITGAGTAGESASKSPNPSSAAGYYDDKNY